MPAPLPIPKMVQITLFCWREVSEYLLRVIFCFPVRLVTFLWVYKTIFVLLDSTDCCHYLVFAVQQ